MRSLTCHVVAIYRGYILERRTLCIDTHGIQQGIGKLRNEKRKLCALRHGVYANDLGRLEVRRESHVH